MGPQILLGGVPTGKRKRRRVTRGIRNKRDGWGFLVIGGGGHVVSQRQLGLRGRKRQTGGVVRRGERV